MLVLHISAESVKRLQHICILDALRSPRTRTKMLLIGGGGGGSGGGGGGGGKAELAGRRSPELELSDSFLKHTVVLSIPVHNNMSLIFEFPARYYSELLNI